MFIDKKNKIKNYSKVSIDLLKSLKENVNSYTEEFLSTQNLGKTCYNLIYEDGRIKQNNGLRELVLPTEQAHSDEYEKTLHYLSPVTLKKVWRYKYYSQLNSRYEYVLLAYASDKKIYYNNIFSYGSYLSAVGSFTFDEEPTLISFRINGADCVGFATSTNNLVVWNCDSSPYAVATAPKFRSICLHNNKMFAIEDGANYVVRYSSVVNPTSWTTADDSTGGRIDLDDFRGELRKVVSHLDNVYVFRDFGISKITLYASGTQFSASNIYNSSTKIYTNTICVCDGDICFLAEDGLYKFDGYKVVKIDLSIFKNFKQYLQTSAQTCFYNGKLYIACYLNFSSSQPNSILNNSVVEVDLQTKSFSIIYGVNVCNLFALKDLNMSKLVVCINDATNGVKLWELCSGKDSSLTFNKFWQSNNFVVTNEREIKILKSVYVKCLKNFTLEVTSENGSKTISIVGGAKLQELKINLRGKIFSVNISSALKEFDLTILKFNFVV